VAFLGCRLDLDVHAGVGYYKGDRVRGAQGMGRSLRSNVLQDRNNRFWGFLRASLVSIHCLVLSFSRFTSTYGTAHVCASGCTNKSIRTSKYRKKLNCAKETSPVRWPSHEWSTDQSLRAQKSRTGLAEAGWRRWPKCGEREEGARMPEGSKAPSPGPPNVIK